MIEIEKELEETRQEFDKVWPDIWNKIGPILDQEPNLHIGAWRASWIVWKAATEQRERELNAQIEANKILQFGLSAVTYNKP